MLSGIILLIGGLFAVLFFVVFVCCLVLIFKIDYDKLVSRTLGDDGEQLSSDCKAGMLIRNNNVIFQSIKK